MTRFDPFAEIRDLYVTRPVLPPFEEFMDQLRPIWSSRILTNRGPLVVEFERQLGAFLGVEHVTVVSNATIGLMVALLGSGALCDAASANAEVITTPFSFVATANAIRLCGATPVFADIDPRTMALDPAEAEKRITPRTRAIMPVHCYGIPCDLDGFDELGARHGIPVIHDASHAFGVRRAGRSILEAGTMSVLSFHATKVFNAAEGGAIISRTAEAKREVERLCNHGILNETTVPAAGLNGKMSEIHAALGLVQLRHVEAEIAARGAVARRYAEAFRSIPGIRPVCPVEVEGHNNYAYPVMVGPDYPLSRDGLHAHLRMQGIVARRYFFPLIPHLAAYAGSGESTGQRFPVAEDAAERVLCLPMYGDLDLSDQLRVIEAIRNPGVPAFADRTARHP